MTARKGSDWTEAREAQLSLMWTEGHTAARIAAIMGGVTRSGVLGKVHRMDLATRQIQGPHSYPRDIAKRKSAPCRASGLPTVRRPSLPEPVAVGPIGNFPEAGTCRYIAGDPASHDWQCCGAPGQPWCEFHERVVFQPIVTRRKAA